MTVGELYNIQARSFTFNHKGKEVRLPQDTIIEIKKVELGKVVFWNNYDNTFYEIDTMGLRMVI